MIRERSPLTDADMDLALIPQGHWSAALALAKLEPATVTRLRLYGERHADVTKRGLGLYLVGPNGVGKSSAAVAVLKEYMRHGYTGLYLTAQELVDSKIDGRALAGCTMSVWHRAETVDVLVIDDLGKEHRAESGFAIKVFDQIFRTRGASLLSTIVTTNMDRDKIPVVYKTSLFESMRALVTLDCRGPNMRVRESGL